MEDQSEFLEEPLVEGFGKEAFQSSLDSKSSGVAQWVTYRASDSSLRISKVFDIDHQASVERGFVCKTTSNLTY